jgi:putative restriction endonuclease
MTLEEFATAFTKLRVNTARSSSPHKPCMLLAVLDLAEAGALAKNEIRYLPNLLERYAEYFDIVRTQTDHASPYLPFFHLRGDEFWHLIPINGRESQLASMRTARSHTDIQTNVDHVELNPELYRYLRDANARAALRNALIERWFPDRAEALNRALAAHSEEDAYELTLREGTPPPYTVTQRVGQAAFRNVVLQAYDYRCAATGWRLIVPGAWGLIDAAHLIPYAETQNNDPRNGMALTPTFHRALDQNLIAPGPDLKWHVSRVVEPRIPDNRPIVDLDGQDVIFYGDPKYRPSPTSLEWRMTNLRDE